MLDAVEKEVDPNISSCPIHMLVNCAGMAICGKITLITHFIKRSLIFFGFMVDCSTIINIGTIEDTSIEDAHKMMDLNYFGTYYPTRHCLTKMKKQRQGIIVITASQAALMGIYGYGAYGAAKFALRGLAETIAMEASHCGVSVRTVVKKRRLFTSSNLLFLKIKQKKITNSICTGRSVLMSY